MSSTSINVFLSNDLVWHTNGTAGLWATSGKAEFFISLSHARELAAQLIDAVAVAERECPPCPTK